MTATSVYVQPMDNNLHKPEPVVSYGYMRPAHWGEGHLCEEGAIGVDTWAYAVKRLSRSGIESLGDLGRLADTRGVDAAIRLVAEACRSTS